MNPIDTAGIKALLISKLFEMEWFDSTGGLVVRPVSPSNIAGLALLYRNAFLRGEWFGAELSIKHVEDISEDAIASHFLGKRSLGVVFEDQLGRVVGATGLFIDEIEGVLIDETQIDPVLGRRKGVMTRYFRFIIPILKELTPFWTEFILTPESYVLRRVLIDELGMQITGLRPNSYVSLVTGVSYSALVACGPAEPPRQFLMELLRQPNLEVQRFASACLGSLIKSGIALEFKESDIYLEKQILVEDFSTLSQYLNMGWRPVAASQRRSALTVAKHRSLDASVRSRFVGEGIDAMECLILFMTRGDVF